MDFQSENANIFQDFLPESIGDQKNLVAIYHSVPKSVFLNEDYLAAIG